MQGTPRDRTRSRPQVASSGFRDAGVPCHQVYVEVAGRLTEWGADLSAYPDRGLATSARAPPPPRDALVYQRGYWPFPSCICCGVFFLVAGCPPPSTAPKGGRGVWSKGPRPPRPTSRSSSTCGGAPTPSPTSSRTPSSSKLRPRRR